MVSIPWERLVIVMFLVFLGGALDGLGDTLQFHFDKSPFSDSVRFSKQFWDPSVSWTNKYLNNDVALGSAFPFSTTALVFLTDGWHLLKFLKLKALLGATIVGLPLLRDSRHRQSTQSAEFSQKPSQAIVVGWYVAAFVLVHLAYQTGFVVTYR